ncbi:MAG: ABC transporter substrate-binding protein [Polyangiaceae bacterium]|nr:ABC transporter substrate-binding protein [Polyangiaceae bacterium]
MTHTTRRAVLGALGSLATALAIGGCKKPVPAGEQTGQAQPGSSTAPVAAAPVAAGPDKTYVIAWSVWTGWMPFKLIQEKGFLSARAKENGVKIELKEFKGYMDSVQAFAAKKVDGVAMTSMESLQPASNGVDSVAIIVNDISNGGDGVLLRGTGAKLEDIKGKTVLLEEFSVSHYLLNRALESKGLQEKDVKVKNIPGDEAGKAFLTDRSVQAVATWNPHLFQAVDAKQGTVVFSSKDIPGEVIDFLFVNGQALQETPRLGTALAEAWYDAMAFIVDAKTRPEAIEIMAKGAGANVEEFNRMLGDTDLFTDRKRCVEFLEGARLKETMGRVKKFSFDKGLIKDEGFEIGFGATGAQKLRFDATYARAK